MIFFFCTEMCLVFVGFFQFLNWLSYKIRNCKINKLHSFSLRVLFFLQESTGSKVKAVQSSQPPLTYKAWKKTTDRLFPLRHKQEVHICQGPRSGACVFVCVGWCIGHRSKVIFLVSDPPPFRKTLTYCRLKRHLGP